MNLLPVVYLVCPTSYIYNGIIFTSLNYAKIFKSIPDEHSQQEVRELDKSRVQWFTSNKI